MRIHNACELGTANDVLDAMAASHLTPVCLLCCKLALAQAEDFCSPRRMQMCPGLQKAALSLCSQEAVSGLLLKDGSSEQRNTVFRLLHNQATVLFQQQKDREAAADFFAAAYLFAPADMKGKLARHQALCALALQKTDRWVVCMMQRHQRVA